MLQRAAIYIRVSTDRDTQKYSPEHQLAACLEYAKAEGLTTNGGLVYNDAGHSGTEMEHRFEVQRLITDARAGNFDVVLFTAVSRFGRDLADVFTMKKKLETVYGIRIISIEEGYDSAIEGRNSEMVFTVHAMLAAHKSKEMSAAIKRGLRQAAREGRHIGSIPPYGYTKNMEKQLIPEPTEAMTVKDIFSMYLDGSGSKEIAKVLNRRGVQTAMKARLGKETLWQASTINKILHNDVYIGRLVAHRWHTGTDYRISRQADSTVTRQSMRDESEWIVLDRAHEAIIDTEIFYRVQALLAKKARNKGLKRTSNLLAGLMKCKECGGSMIISDGGRRIGSAPPPKYIVCSRRRRIGSSACPNGISLSHELIVREILKNLRSLTPLKPDFNQLSNRIMNRVRSEQLEWETRTKLLERQLQQNQDQQKKILHAFSKGLFSADVIEQEQRILALEAKRLKDEISQNEILHQSGWNSHIQLDQIQAHLHALNHFDKLDRTTQLSVMHTLVQSIEFDADGNVDIEYTWKQYP